MPISSLKHRLAGRLTILSALFCSVGHAGSSVPVQLFSELSFEVEFKRFTHQKSANFLLQYSFEENLSGEVALVSLKDQWFLMFRSELNAGMGESPYGLAIHPFDISYGLVPAVEYRFRCMYVASGIDHRCFHYVDQEPPSPIVYWNRLFLSAGSLHKRVLPHTRALLTDSICERLGRFAWNVSGGFYLSEFFGMVRPINLMSLSRPHYLQENSLDGRYYFLIWKKGAASVGEKVMLGFKRNGSAYWLMETGVAAHFAFRDFDLALFSRFSVDGGRFNSKDQLFETGFTLSK